MSLRCEHRASFAKVEVSSEVEVPGNDGSVSEIGVRVTTEMGIFHGIPGQWIGLWSIIQMPAGGEVILPVRGNSQPRDCFQTNPSNEFRCDADSARVRIGGAAEFKLVNDGGRFGGFGEIEHHAPAIRCGEGRHRMKETGVSHIRWVPEVP